MCLVGYSPLARSCTLYLSPGAMDSGPESSSQEPHPQLSWLQSTLQQLNWSDPALRNLYHDGKANEMDLPLTKEQIAVLDATRQRLMQLSSTLQSVTNSIQQNDPLPSW